MCRKAFHFGILQGLRCAALQRKLSSNGKTTFWALVFSLIVSRFLSLFGVSLFGHCTTPHFTNLNSPCGSEIPVDSAK